MKTQSLLFAGSSQPQLAQEVSTKLGIPLGRISLNQFPDGEIHVEILENVYEKEVFILQSIALDPNYHLLELLIIADALKRLSAKSIIAIIPYLGYCRQNYKDKPGVAITAKLISNLMDTSGITHLITFDLHTDQIEGFFDIPVYQFHCQQLLCESAKEWMKESTVVVAPDIGSLKIAERTARLLALDLAVIRKQRINMFDVEMDFVGNVKNKNVLIVDDLCSTGSTLLAATTLCKKLGAKKIFAAITHGLFVKEALENIESSSLDALIITNTIFSYLWRSTKIKCLSVAPIIAEAIKNWGDKTYIENPILSISK